jgi:integrase/recombinase XerD
MVRVSATSCRALLATDPIHRRQSLRKDGNIWRPDLASYQARRKLPVRAQAYFTLISYGRHLGVLKRVSGSFWVARVRTKTGSSYRQTRLGAALLNPKDRRKGALTYDEALALANAWFATPEVARFAADPKPLGSRRDLFYSPIGDVFTVGHALRDYVEWKRLVAARTHFETNLSLINFHLAPRLASMPVADFNGEVLREFVRYVLETPPKRGNQQVGPRRAIESIEEDALRKRKKTANTLISILRVALQMAWENGKFDNERAWRCLRHIRFVDRPRILHLSRAECRHLLECCRPDLARLVMGALYTGCRATELLSMRCSQVGRDGYGVYVAPSKTYRPRFVFLPDEGMAWFLSLVEGRKPNDLVFVRDSGKPWFGNQKNLFKAAVRQAELPDEFVFHGLRHTYASQLIQAGATVFAVAEQLGHADPAQVLRTYGHLSPQIRESEVRQRFSTISTENRDTAKQQEKALTAWRSALHGKDWRTYAQIDDVEEHLGDPEFENTAFTRKLAAPAPARLRPCTRRKRL